jgi:hypothetical protein
MTGGMNASGRAQEREISFLLAFIIISSDRKSTVGWQVPRKLIGTDAFQETPIVEVTRQITKHNYLVMDLDDLPRIVKEVPPPLPPFPPSPFWPKVSGCYQ